MISVASPDNARWKKFCANVSARTSPNKISRTCNAGIYLPATTRHNVSGVGTTRPTGPQIQLQKIAAMTTESGDSPVECPYNCGSISLATTISIEKKITNVINARLQPGSIAAANKIAEIAAN